SWSGSLEKYFLSQNGDTTTVKVELATLPEYIGMLKSGFVQGFYHQAIETIKPDLLVGHSLGGYWALKTAAQHKLAVIVANPSL
ncbi:YqiA/YcfP family alpha/beta fold hydrolase, partial [Acinetobacter baumannii]|uniref:YqiA/YcfP family alpha/beta fold hydrolase n=1 Tax=Acinetobacter baumannii TaxID=470 RepID=UPI00294AA343